MDNLLHKFKKNDDIEEEAEVDFDEANLKKEFIIPLLFLLPFSEELSLSNHPHKDN